MSTASAAVRPPFSVLPLQRRSLLERVLRRLPRENAWIEVNNLLATAPEVRAVRPEQVARIAERYERPLRGELCGRLERLYRDYLLYCLSDRHLTSDEMADLAHLKRILRLHNRTLGAIHENVAQQLYARGVNDLLVDAGVNPEEREFLHSLQICLAAPARVAQRARAATVAPGEQGGSSTE
ncbi:MAG TPA: hypothetical protein VF035_04570 [Longimicrobiales bacterium]